MSVYRVKIISLFSFTSAKVRLCENNTKYKTFIFIVERQYLRVKLKGTTKKRSVQLNALNKEDELLTFLLREVAELHNGVVSIALTALVLASVPHDSFEHVSSAAVVQTLHPATRLASQSTSPQWSGTTPTCADIILHPQTVLHEVSIRPYLLVRIARHIAVGGEELGGVLDMIITRLP